MAGSRYLQRRLGNTEMLVKGMGICTKQQRHNPRKTVSATKAEAAPRITQQISFKQHQRHNRTKSWLVTVRLRDWTPVPHDLVQVVQAVKAVTVQWMAHGPWLQTWVSV